MDSYEEAKMPLLEHLIELRKRLVYSGLAIIILFFGCYFIAEDIYGFLVQPLADVMDETGRDRRLIFTALHEAFFTYIKVSFFAAMFLAFPFVAMQIYMFVAPGLYKHEKSAFLPFLIATPILFFLGGALVYYYVLPFAWDFFVSFESEGVEGGMAMQLEAKVNEYLSLVMQLIFAFGICFELPVVMTLLGKIGLVNSKGLAEKRKYAIVMAFVAAAILTPPDPISQIGLALPIIFLYEISIISVRIIEKNRGDEEKDADDDDDDDDDGDDEESDLEFPDEAKEAPPSKPVDDVGP